MSGVMVKLQCESWTLHNHWSGSGGWCTRNSKLGLDVSGMGEIMFATWLLPYNEAVAQWIDPFYDAGPTSHTSIMGGIGGSSIYHSPGLWHNARGNFGDGGVPRPGLRYGVGLDTGLNRRQEDIIQYFSPDWDGFKVRFAMTSNVESETDIKVGTGRDAPTRKVDPQIMSASLSYEEGPIWLAATWQDHEDWTASRPNGLKGTMIGSDTESWRLAGRYIAKLVDGGGMGIDSIQIATMYEDIKYEFKGVSNFDAAMRAFFFTNSDTYNINRPGGITRDEATIGTNVKIEREAWLVSGKIDFVGPLDFRFSYMDADDLDLTCRNCTGDWAETDANSYNVGFFYTTPNGTEFRATYTEVDNSRNSSYATGVNGVGYGTSGNRIELFSVGIVQWFD